MPARINGVQMKREMILFEGELCPDRGIISFFYPDKNRGHTGYNHLKGQCHKKLFLLN